MGQMTWGPGLRFAILNLAAGLLAAKNRKSQA